MPFSAYGMLISKAESFLMALASFKWEHGVPTVRILACPVHAAAFIRTFTDQAGVNQLCIFKAVKKVSRA